MTNHRTYFTPFLVAAALIFCYALVSLSSDYNPIRKVTPSDSPRHLEPSAEALLSRDHIQDHDDNDDGGDDVSFPTFSSSATIEAIYQFGDSIADTGNIKLENPNSKFAKLPYGQTFFHKPTGRCSNGLLIIDFFCKFFNLPFLEPYLNKDGNFTHGVNFAVSGATALNTSTLAKKGILFSYTNSSLYVQLDWFKSHLKSICSSPSECKEKLAKALFLIGEIGGNDYNGALFQREKISEIYKLVPEVVEAIKSVVKEVINLGAVNIVVPGNFPVGCMTIYLNMFKTNDPTKYDELQCLTNLNNHAKFHNNKLQQVIEELQRDHPNVTIMYADYFSALQEIIRDATSFGFNKDPMRKACCRFCGHKGESICEHPYKYVSWDEVHLTQHAYQSMAKWLIKHTFHEITHRG